MGMCRETLAPFYVSETEPTSVVLGLWSEVYSHSHSTIHESVLTMSTGPQAQVKLCFDL
jgi:hypothetical protein